VLLNNFLHDFSAAGWLVGAVFLWSVLRKTTAPGPAIIDASKTVLFLMRCCAGGIVIFGIVRTVAYKSYEWNSAAGQNQLTLIAVKHVFFTGLFVLGLRYYIKACRFVKGGGDEQAK
jgi:hypothetical protein